MGSSLKGSPSTSTTNNQPNPVVMAAYEQLLNQANQTAQNNPFQPYPGTFTADLNANQLAAMADVSSLPQAVGAQFITPASNLMNAGANTMLGGLSYLPAAAGLIGQGASYIPQGAGYINQGAGMIGQGSDIAQSALPAFNTALGYAQQATTPLQNLIPGLLSPYIQDVVDKTQAQFNNANSQQGNALLSQAIRAGNAFGGDRAGVGEAQLANQQQLAQAPVIAGLYNQGWQSALQGAEAQNQLALGAAGAANQSGAGIGQIGGIVGNLGLGMGSLGSQLGQLGGLTGQLGSQLAGVGLGQANIGSALGGLGSSLGSLGLNYGNANLQDYLSMYQMGSGQQQTQQQLLNALYNQYLMQQAFPYQQVSWLGNLVEGLGSGLGGTSQTTSQQSFNPLSSIVGLGMAALLGNSDERIKEDIEPIGKTFAGDTVYRYRFKGSPKEEIGLMAQDVEETRPHAVYTRPDTGTKMLDYRAATDEAADRGHFAFGGVPHRDLGGGLALGAAPYGQFGMPGMQASGFGGVPLTAGRGGMGIPTGTPAPQPQQQNPLDPMRMITQSLLKGGGKKLGSGLSSLFGGPGSSLGASGIAMPDIAGSAVENAGEGMEVGDLGLADTFLAKRGGMVPHYDDGGGIQGDPYGMNADYADYLVLNNMLGSESAANQAIAHMIPEGFKRGGIVDGDEDIGSKIRSIMSAVGLDERPGFADGGSDDDTEDFAPGMPGLAMAATDDEADRATMTPPRPHNVGRSSTRGTEALIERAAAEYGLDPATMKGIASIESSMNPSSNANNPRTQYKGLYQMGRNEWNQYGGGNNIYDAESNARGAAHMLADHAAWFKQQYGRDPSPGELYMMHQQGRGFFSNGAMTNIAGNPYPGMNGPQNHNSFMQGWSNELQRRMARYDGSVGDLPQEAKAQAGFPDWAPTPESELRPQLQDAVYRTNQPPRMQPTPDRAPPASGSSSLGGFNPLGLSDEQRRAMIIGALGMAAGNSQYALQNLANGALYGMSSLQAADALSQKAKQTQAALDRQDKKTQLEQDKFDEDKRKQEFAENEVRRRRALAEHKQDLLENQPKYGVIGEDKYGQKQYGWIYPQSGEVKPVGAIGTPQAPSGTQPAAAPGAGTPPAPVAPVAIAPVNTAFKTPDTPDPKVLDQDIGGDDRPGLHPEVLEGQDPDVVNMVKRLSQGKQKWPNLSRQNPFNRQVISLLEKYDENADEQTYATRQKTMNAFGTGVEGRSMTAFNTLGQHLGELDDIVTGLNNHGIPGITALRNMRDRALGDDIARSLGFESRAQLLGSADIATKGVADEGAKVFAGTNSALADRTEWLKHLGSITDDTQGVARSKLSELTHLTNGRLNALANQYNTGMRTSHVGADLVAPETQAVFDRISRYPTGVERGAGAGTHPASQPTAPVGAAPTESGQELKKPTEAQLQQGRDLIKKGYTKDQIERQMKLKGFDPSGL